MKGRTLADCHRATGGKVNLGGGISAPRYGTQSSVTNEAKKGTTGILSSSNAAPKSFSKRGKFRHGGAVQKKAEGGGVKDWSGEGDSGKGLRAKAKEIRDEPNATKAMLANVAGTVVGSLANARRQGPGLIGPGAPGAALVYTGKKIYDAATADSRAKTLEGEADKAEGRKCGGRAKRADGGETSGGDDRPNRARLSQDSEQAAKRLETTADTKKNLAGPITGAGLGTLFAARKLGKLAGAGITALGGHGIFTEKSDRDEARRIRAGQAEPGKEDRKNGGKT